MPGDIRHENVGLSPRARERLAGVDTVVHSAAHVGWLAEQEVLETTNVQGTAHVARLARDLGARLHYVSTASVAYAEPRELPYVASKVRAERVVLGSGGPARIWRIGLLAGRLRDGAFPLAESEDNGLLLLLSTLLDRSSDHDDDARIAQARRDGASIELTPVDVCAELMVHPLLHGADLEPILVLKHDTPFALGNLDRLGDGLVPPLSRRLPRNVVATILASTVEAAADPCHDRTRALLVQEGLAWPPADEAYVRRFLEYAASTSGPVPRSLT